MPQPVAAAPMHPFSPAGGAHTRRVSRDDITALARQGRVWEFVPLALRVLKQFPDDHGMRLMVASSYARLGLRAVTAEHLDLLPTELQRDPSVGALRQAVAAFPADDLPLATRAARCDANLRVLRARGVDLSARSDEWLERQAGERWFTARDGNVLRRAANDHPDDPWIHFRNDRAEVLNFPFPHLATPDKAAKPYVVEGLFPAWMLQRLYERTPAAADGYRTRIGVVQEDPLEALDGLACADLGTLLADDRVELYIGEGAGERYAAALRHRMDTQAGGPAVVLATVRRRATPSVAATLECFAGEQHAEHKRLLGEVERVYVGRDREWWRRRYAAAAGEPLRVLVPTCRYSTFVKHSAADLAEAFAGAGWKARVLIEPDDRSHLSSVAYLRELATFQPDLIVLINYTRASIGSFIPATVPFVCWLQDAMPHQFDAKLAAKQGPLDFLAGYVHPELFDEFGFERRRAALFGIAVSPRKFHPAAPDAAARQRFACEIAYASHHSETPEAMHARLVAEAGAKEPLAGRIFEELRAPVQEIALASMDHLPGVELREAAHRVARRVLGAEPPEGTVTMVARQYCLPLADRLIRHQTLAWAARIAERRGWRLAIHGRGWEKHAAFSRHARGELAHDDALRASYHTAKVHLHASINWLLHQRVMECALSGGLPLVRLKKSDLVQWEQAVIQSLCRGGKIVMERRTPLLYREYGYAVADDAGAMEYASQLQRLGLEAPWDLWVHGRPFDRFVATAPEALEPPAGWVLGDLSQTTFRTEEELERLVERAVSDDAWREGVSAMIASRVRRRHTTDVLAGQLHAMVNAELYAEA